ncbi:MAG TPA: hypothetical protein VJP85_07950 [Candidatus Baltobacteraceae bacterium]|nr:hypothetical protein [Candidatus Baltobacteraceae bacterium]
MNVVDLPEHATRGLYDEAISRYAAMVKGRAVGVHRVGNVRYPGLSDIDLLVVTEHEGVDNRYFFSALQRLPQRFHRLFLHEPFILPAWSLRVMRYTTHRAPQLVAGRDVLRPYAPNDEPAERWCRMLESYCSYAAFAAKTRTAQMLKGRLTMAVASAFRFLLGDAQLLLPHAADDSYVNRIEDVRRTFFEGGEDRVERVRTAWKIFSGAFDRFDAALQAHVGAASTDEAVSIARARLLGEQQCDDFDRNYAFRRAQDIDGYHQELASLGFPFGHLFFVAAHPRAVRRVRQTVLDTLLRNVYRVRRRLTEYAPGA